MSRPMLLVFLLLILIITSQFEWRQQTVNDTDTTPGISEKQLKISKREDTTKDKIILSQEKNIYRLNKLVISLQQQLLLCGCNNETTNATSNAFADHGIQLERQQILED